MVDKQTIDELGEKIACAAVALDRGEHTLLAAIRPFEQLEGWHHQGALSLGMWLSWRIGMSPAVAREKRRALKERDGVCQFPGCTYRRDLDAHHLEHWIHGGKTRLSNLVEVCRRHHRYVHEFGYDVRRTDDGLQFFDPEGRAIPAVPPRPRVEPLVSTKAAWPRWDGTHPNYALCVDALMAAHSPPLGAG